MNTATLLSITEEVAKLKKSMEDGIAKTAVAEIQRFESITGLAVDNVSLYLVQRKEVGRKKPLTVSVDIYTTVII